MDSSAGEFTPAVTPLDVIEDQITELSAHVSAATFRLLVLIREFDARGGWSGPGMRSCAHWLNWKCGLDMGAAREKVRVAHALALLPLISAAFERGEVSYSKVRAMTRVATPANEESLLNVALHGTAHHVERLVRGYRRVQRLEDANRQHAERFVSWHVDEDGCLVIRGRVPAELGALIMKGLEAAVEVVREREVATGVAPAGEEQTAAGRRADALGLMAETFIANGPGELAGGERYQLVVHCGREASPDGGVATGVAPTGHESGEGDELRVSAETCRRMGCDCSLVHVTEDENGGTLDVGRRTRSIPPAIMRALRVRDKGCRFPGCTCKRYVDGHHIRHWADGGDTKLSNLVLLCRFHHRLVHEGGYSVAVEKQSRLASRLQFGFWRPDGTRVGDAGRSGPVPDTASADFAAANAARGIVITSGTGIPDWGGEQMDDDIAIEGLLRARSTAKPVHQPSG